MWQLAPENLRRNGLRANWSYSPRVKNHFLFEARKAYLRILRRLTLWFRLCWANAELVGFPAPSRPAQRDVAKTDVSPGEMDSQLLAQSQLPGQFRMADVSILEDPPLRIDNYKVYSPRADFSTLFDAGIGA
jgi:hypothetical protein